MNNKIWTEAANSFIRANADKLKDRELAEELSKIVGRTVTMGAARKQRQKLKIAKECGREVCRVKQVSGFMGRAIIQGDKK